MPRLPRLARLTMTMLPGLVAQPEQPPRILPPDLHPVVLADPAGIEVGRYGNPREPCVIIRVQRRSIRGGGT